ncbi:hypothetical protein FA13DRAFT_1720959 [Coprinellus micaceus]|uniref:Uncharacterized protein n=1 Tax=Coprinellus micaceus TaxID=71717 RepID=A0A4Y7S516_COPMI|nr:hypothetical protein FA13DRAFT_1720959 [Coprinellus micaceus]
MDGRPAGWESLDDGPAPRHRLLAFPPPQRYTLNEDGEEWTGCGVAGQIALQHIANVYPYVDINVVLLNKATETIAPSSRFYITVECGSVLREFRSQARGIYIWMMAGDLDLGGHLPISEYAIQFYMVIGERFRAIGLAKVVLDFMKTYKSEADGIHFNIVKICYKFSDAGVMGVMFINGGLGGAYDQVQRMARQGGTAFDMHEDMPVTFWPPGSPRCRVGGETYTALIEHTRMSQIKLKGTTRTNGQSERAWNEGLSNRRVQMYSSELYATNVSIFEYTVEASDKIGDRGGEGSVTVLKE